MNTMKKENVVFAHGLCLDPKPIMISRVEKGWPKCLMHLAKGDRIIEYSNFQEIFLVTPDDIHFKILGLEDPKKVTRRIINNVHREADELNLLRVACNLSVKLTPGMYYSQ